MILAIALSSLRITAIYFNRIAIILLLYSGVLAYNTLYTGPVGSGVGVFGGLFQVTTITQSMDVFIYLVGALVLLLGEHWTLISKGKGLPVLAEYPLIVLFTVLGMSSLISSSDLVSMFLSIELQSFAVYILATIYRESESATSAGLKYFLLGSLSSALILLGSSLLYGFTGLTTFDSLYMLCSTTSTNHYIELAVLLMAIGLLFKVSAAPFHSAFPSIYSDVPTVVTTLLTTLPKLSVFFLLIELQQIFHSSTHICLLFLISALLSLVFGSLGGLAQYRIKRLLAYSAISHVGFLLFALSLNSSGGTEAFLFYLIQYTFTTVNVFFILIAFGNLVPEQYSIYSPVSYINQLKGQFTVNPLLSLSLAISLLSLAGIPPLIGFFGKQMILLSALHEGYFFVSILAILLSVVSAFYYLKVIRVVHFDPTTTPGVNEAQEGRTQTVISTTIAVITLLLIFFILNPTPLLNSAHLLTLSLFDT
jgi:NADH-ubiquinone oxidoreductase chain 2